jgi:queuine tRNA-ribosyltransferase
MQVQNDLGADIIMAFDECPSAAAPAEYHRTAVERTLRWSRHCIESHARPSEQALFGIVQGGTDMALREHCAAELIKLDFPGYAIGGLAVGEGFEAMKSILGHVTPMLPPEKPRYLMGVGYPRDLAAAVASGIDMFDCVLPTRNGRNAYAFTAAGPLRLRNSQYQRDPRPIEPGCDCYACMKFTRGAIRHYFFASEMLGPILVSVHNIRFYQRFMADIRKSLADGSFAQFLASDSRCMLGPTGKDDPTIE